MQQAGKGRICGVRFVIAAILALGASAPVAAREIKAPADGAVRAVLVGIDLYRNVPPLKGAVADAEDLSVSLRAAGVGDMTLLENGDASREQILAAIAAVTQRTAKGDLVILGIAGHGSSEPERVKGSKPGGRDEVYVLAGFDTRLPGSRERIFGDEFKAMIRAIEDKGADVLFVADTCFAGGMTRDADPRGEAISYRQAPSYRIEEDDLTPISTAADALSTPYDFARLTFLAAVDRFTKSPEISIPGIAQRRGALSYATARAFEGAADRNGDGVVSRRELFEYVRQTVYQYTDQRQNIFTESPPGQDLERSPVFAFRDASSGSTAEDPTATGNAALRVEDGPLKVAVIGGDAKPIAEAAAGMTPFSIVAHDQAELVFDAAASQAIAGGDVIATAVTPRDLPFVVDRMAALKQLKRIAGLTSQAIRVTPSDRVHHEGEKVGAEIGDIAGRHLVLFDITGDGTVQLLYPDDRDPIGPMEGDLSLKLGVVKPFGTDLLVAVSTEAAPDALIGLLKQLDGRRAAGTIATRLSQYLPAGARLGFTVLYTAAGAKP